MDSSSPIQIVEQFHLSVDPQLIRTYHLPPEDQLHFDSATLWDALVLEVVEFLRGGGS